MKGGLTISRRVTRSMTTLDRNSLTLPVEVVTEILSRLPLASIARCRCVCKLWSSILRRQDFTELFFTKSCARPQLLFVLDADREIVSFFSSPQPENPEENSYVVAANHLARFPSSYGFSDIVSGFFCYTSGFFCYKAEQIFEGMKVPVICNPSTGQSLTLPRLKPGRDSYLGYDPISKDFKVLSMESEVVSGEEISVKHQVLTLGAKKLSWRLVECSVPHLSFANRICISGVLYYTAAAKSSYVDYMVVCFDLRSEKLSFVKFSRALPNSTTLVNYNRKLGLLMSGDSGDIGPPIKSLELWVLQDAGKSEWSKHVYVLPPLGNDVGSRSMHIVGMVGINEIVLAPWFQSMPSYVIYYNVERKTITKVGIQGLEAFQGKSFTTYLNYVENVKLL